MAAAGEPRTLGILGGSFNPPHLGHLELARHARAELAIERVALMPAASAPHKPAAEDPGAEHRLRMCRLLVGDSPGVCVCELEIERGGRSYTVDTLRDLHERHPRAELTFIAGADTAGAIAGWREPQALLGLASLAVAARGSSSREQVLDALAAAGVGDGAPARVRFVSMPALEISSSQARARAARGEPLAELVGGAVARYIERRRLYRAAGESRA